MFVDSYGSSDRVLSFGISGVVSILGLPTTCVDDRLKPLGHRIQHPINDLAIYSQPCLRQYLYKYSLLLLLICDTIEVRSEFVEELLEAWL